MSVQETCRAAARASTVLRGLDTATKNAALRAIGAAIERNREKLLHANSLDVDAARAAGTSSTLIDRLTLTEGRLDGMMRALETVIALDDPVGEVVGARTRPQGLLVERVREPLGVVAVIYEARPNVAVEVAALCLKSGNAAVLRGSSIATATNEALVAAVGEALAADPVVPESAVALIADTSREAALELMRQTEYVDLLVPRGGPELIATVEAHATVPTVIDGAGNCHLYVDAHADREKAARIAVNAKTSRPSVCNALETLLVHRDVADAWLPPVLDELADVGVTVRGCPATRERWPAAQPADERDWATEYLDLELAVRVVDSVDEALEHIGRFGTRNADGIVTDDLPTARRFARGVDTGTVFVNASTRFSDGGEFGFGVEIGVSTQKLHVRGPMGLQALTCVKNVVWGDGHVRVLS